MVQQQRAQLDGLMEEARGAGCIGGFFFKKRGGPGCGQLNATIDRAQASLKRLQKQRNKFAGDPFGGGRQRNAILSALAANQCSSASGETYAYEPPRHRGFFATLFGGPQVWGDNNFRDDRSYGTFRTLCVRTCDGYYFPISFSTVAQKFAADEQACHAMCPGTEVTLYTYRNPGEDMQSAVSLSGAPYTALPTAFQYRQSFNAACTCHTATAGAEGTPPADATPANPGGDFVTIPTDPSATAPPAASPPSSESGTANAGLPPAGAAAPAPAPEPPSTASEGFGPAPKKQVRIVGPSYYVAE
jgi:hypothetical protein